MALASVLLSFGGVGLLTKSFDEILSTAVEEDRRSEWYVVSSVVYGEVLEWSTPHWRVAIHILSDKIQFSGEEQQNMFNAMLAGGFIRKDLVLQLKGVVEDLIKANGLVDTGNYLGSIAIGPSRDEAFSQSDIQLLDSTTSVFAI